MIAGDIVRVYLLPHRDPLITGLYLRDDMGSHVMMEMGQSSPWLAPGRMCYITIRDVGKKYEIEIIA